MTISATLATISDALDQVNGLRVQTKAGKVNVPAAVVELGQITAPATLDASVTADGQVRVLLLVQTGDMRNTLERAWGLIDPAGTVSTSAMVALLSADEVEQVTFEGPGLVEYGGTQYTGGIFTCSVWFD